jgi:hypothetical protein
VEYIPCAVLSRLGTRVVLETPIGNREVNMGHFSSRFTYLGTLDKATGESKTGGYMKFATGLNLGQRMTRQQRKCEHIFFVWETPWRFSLTQSEGPARFQLCGKCGLGVGFRLQGEAPLGRPPVSAQDEPKIETERQPHEATSPHPSSGAEKAAPFDPVEAANQFSRRMGRALTSEEYEDAVSKAAGEFARRLQGRLPMSDKQQSLAEREVAMLYLTAARAWFHRLEPREESRLYGGDQVVGEMAASCWCPDPDVWSTDAPDRWLEELDAMVDARSAEYGDLALSRPLNASKELGRRFALRLRAEVNGSHEVEELAPQLFGELPNLDAGAMVRRFVSDQDDEDEDWVLVE